MALKLGRKGHENRKEVMDRGKNVLETEGPQVYFSPLQGRGNPTQTNLTRNCTGSHHRVWGLSGRWLSQHLQLHFSCWIPSARLCVRLGLQAAWSQGSKVQKLIFQSHPQQPASSSRCHKLGHPFLIIHSFPVIKGMASLMG